MADLTSYHRDRYAIHQRVKPKGFAPDPAKCAAGVSVRLRGWTEWQCSRKRGHGPEGAFCRQHARKHEEGKDG